MPKPADEMFLGPWPLGMNNRQPDYALPAQSLRNAVNADFDMAGFVRRRSGYTKVYGGVNTHSGFSCPAGEFLAEGSTLRLLNADNTTTVLSNGLTGGRIAYEYVNGEVYFSDGVSTGKVVSGVVTPWGMDCPPQPDILPISGVFGQGTYIAALTRVDAAGRESGASEVSSVTTAAGAGIKFYNLPSSTALRLYLSPPDSTTLFLVAEVPAGTVDYIVMAGRYDTGKPLDTQFVSRPPPGRIIKWHKGHMYIAIGGTLWYTEPYAPDRVVMSRNFFQFPTDISIVEPVKAGLWIVADKTYFYRGDAPTGMSEEIKLEYGATFGTSSRIQNTNDIMWYSDRGIVMASQDGTISNKQEANVAVGAGTEGAAIARDKDGVQQFIASIKDPAVSPLVSQSFFSAEVIRKATP